MKIMSNLYEKITIVLFLSMFLFVCSCSSPEGGGSSDTEDTLSPPENLSVVKDMNSNDLIIDWDKKDNGVAYDIVRVVGGLDTIIKDDQLDITVYYDSTYPVDENVQYKVRSVKGSLESNFSPLSAPMNIAASDITVENLAATSLERDNGIYIQWDDITQDGINASYKLKRYTTKVDYAINPNLGKDIVIGNNSLTYNANGTVSYLDTSAAVNTNYYYLVDWVDNVVPVDGRESSFIFGIYGDEDDHQYENNSDWEQLPDSSTTFPGGTELQLYSFEDDGVYNDDTDWYVYKGTPRDIQITLNGADLVGKVRLDFFYNNQIITSGVYSFSPRIFMFMKDQFSDPESQEPEKLYFRISRINSAENFIGSYSITTNY